MLTIQTPVRPRLFAGQPEERREELAPQETQQPTSDARHRDVQLTASQLASLNDVPAGGLVLSRRKGQTILLALGDEIVAIDVADIKGNQAKLKFRCQRHVKVWREELVDNPHRAA